MGETADQFFVVLLHRIVAYAPAGLRSTLSALLSVIAILVVFAILLTRGAGVPEYRGFSSSWLVGLAIAAAVFALLTWAVTKSLPAAVASAATPAVTVQSIGVALMSSYVLPLEIVALVLTVALIGAVIVAMPETRAPKSGNAQGGGK